jgi:phospholipid-binding lipoprotein MlaA
MAQNVVLGVLLATLMVLPGACATAQRPLGQTGARSVPASSTPAPDEVGAQAASLEQRPDPLEPFNQSILTFNRQADDWVLHPVARGYAHVVPEPVRASVTRFFQNVGVIPRFANDLLQGQFNQAGVEAARFGVNSTLGIGGFFDPADKWFGLKQQPNDFGLTLAKYGVQEGPYLVLPILGPSTVRDAFGKLADGAMNPVNFTAPSSALGYEAAAETFAAVNARSQKLSTFEDVDRYSVDLYGAVQDAYLQRRVQEVNRVRTGE